MPVFRQFPKGSVIGSGAYVFRHYGSEAPIMRNYLCFTAEEENSTVGMGVSGTPTQGQAFETSTDGITWTEFIPGTTVITLANIGDKVYFRGDNVTVSEMAEEEEEEDVYLYFEMTGLIAGSGNVMSLIDKTCESTTIESPGCFCLLFMGCTSLTTAPELPATSLSACCYTCMFYECTSLTTPPELHATVLSEACYLSMFNYCTSLVTPPKLPATTMTYDCYCNMFYGCTSLKISETQEGEYQYPWRIPTSGTGSEAVEWNDDMLFGTGGTFTDDPTINTTYYTDHAPV